MSTYPLSHWKLSDSLRSALATMPDPPARAGSYETGHMGSTLHALERRGLVEARWSQRPYKHATAVLTDVGAAVRAQLHERAARRLEAHGYRHAGHGLWRFPPGEPEEGHTCTFAGAMRRAEVGF